MLRDQFPHAKKVLIDANVLVILVVGQTRQTLIASVSPGDYSLTPEDFTLITSEIAAFEASVTTPYLLAEVNTLFPKPDVNTVLECRSTLGSYIPLLENNYIEPAVLSQDRSFASFGIADVSIVHAADSSTLVLTADWALTGLLASRGCSVIHYEVLRQQIDSIL
jgi:hypothetical protein